MQAVCSPDPQKKTELQESVSTNLFKIIREAIVSQVSEKFSNTLTPAKIATYFGAYGLYELFKDLNEIYQEITCLKEERSENNEKEVNREIQKRWKKFAVRFSSGVSSMIGSTAGVFFCSIFIPAAGYICGVAGQTVGLFFGNIVGTAIYEMIQAQYINEFCMEGGCK